MSAWTIGLVSIPAAAAFFLAGFAMGLHATRIASYRGTIRYALFHAAVFAIAAVATAGVFAS